MTSTAVPTARTRAATRRKTRRPSRILLHLFLAFAAFQTRPCKNSRTALGLPKKLGGERFCHQK